MKVLIAPDKFKELSQAKRRLIVSPEAGGRHVLPISCIPCRSATVAMGSEKHWLIWWRPENITAMRWMLQAAPFALGGGGRNRSKWPLSNLRQSLDWLDCFPGNVTLLIWILSDWVF